MREARLLVDLRGYWHPGGGRGGGAVVDAVTHRDSAGLPVLPGRHLKGLLRDALEQAETFGWARYAGCAETLFGQRAEFGGTGPEPGCLRVTDATLPPEIAAYLGCGPGKPLVRHLYRNLYSTAVEFATGTARDKSLRGIEVVVPLQLSARLETVSGREPPPEDWVERLAGVLPLIDAVGAHRSRGLGRAVLSLEGLA